MAVQVIPTSVKHAWDAWNIRGIILFSLSLQAILILVAPFRKATGKSFVIFIVWSGYLLADWAANFAVGLISDSQGDTSHPRTQNNADLLAFWAPFLLLHLGGPDTITALALEDNELWLRHMLGLVAQAVAALYVFAQSLPKNNLVVPIVLLFIAGVIKYAERTRALYLASLDRFRNSMLKEPDPGPNYAKLMEEYTTKREAKVPTEIIYIPEPDKENKPPTTLIEFKKHVQVVHKAYKYFNIFKGLVVDLIFSFRERNESRDFFRRLDAESAMRVIEVELNFIYEVMYTKVQVVQSKIGYIVRVIAFGAVLSSFWVFYFIEKSGFNRFDVRVTYTLLLGAIALDVIAFYMLLFSDWTLTKLDVGDDDDDVIAATASKSKVEKKLEYLLPSLFKKRMDDSWQKKLKRFFTPFFAVFLEQKRPKWRPSKCRADFIDEGCDHHEHHVMSTIILFRRWSGSVAGLDLIRFCLKGSPNRIHEFTGWTRVLLQNIAHYTLMEQAYKNLRVESLEKAIAAAYEATTNGVLRFLASITTPIGDSFESLGIRIHRFMAPKWYTSWILVLARWFMIAVGYVLHLPTNLIELFGLETVIDSFLYVSNDRLTKELWTFIFHELKVKADYADDPETAKRISSAKGDWILTDTDTNLPKGFKTEFLQYVTDVKYDESLLLWHIATELCYNHDRPTPTQLERFKIEKAEKKSEDPAKKEDEEPDTFKKKKAEKEKAEKEEADKKEEGSPMKEGSPLIKVQVEENQNQDPAPQVEEATEQEAKAGESKPSKEENGREPTEDEIMMNKFKKHDYREFSKMMSDYMMYLLVMQPTMMSAVAGIGKIRFRDTCAEAKRFFVRRRFKPTEEKKACDQILDVNTDVKPVHVKGDRSKSVLFDACILAKKLNDLDKHGSKDDMDKHGSENVMNKWELLSKIWVELISYAAAHCRANTHAQQLNKGGELVTFVWLLMAHFGLGDQFQINEGHARAKLVVRK